MARYIEAVARLGPRIEPQPNVHLRELAQRMADTTGQKLGEILRVIVEMGDCFTHYHVEGRAIVVPALGTYRPLIKGDGTFRVHYRPDAMLLKSLNATDAFRGQIRNAENIGKSSQELKALWDRQHLDDPLELPALKVT